ncbi:MAG: DUF3368 domain-containing protein [Blastocatellia bacterium]
MALIVSDTSPIHYLALIEETHIFPALFGRVIIPQKVFDELQQPKTPQAVKDLAVSRPPWIEVRAISTPIDSALSHLDRGEQEAITLALEIQASTLLIDETKGRRAAKLKGLKIIGILGVLFAAAEAGLCDLEDAFDKLKHTNFRASESLYQQFIMQYKQGKQ